MALPAIPADPAPESLVGTWRPLLDLPVSLSHLQPLPHFISLFIHLPLTLRIIILLGYPIVGHFPKTTPSLGYTQKRHHPPRLLQSIPKSPSSGTKRPLQIH